MKYLIQYKDFYSFKPIWQFLEISWEGTESYFLTKGPGCITSQSLEKVGQDYYGKIATIEGWFKSKVIKKNIRMVYSGYAKDAYQFSMPEKYHLLPLYTLKVDDNTSQYVLIPETAYTELKKDCKKHRQGC